MALGDHVIKTYSRQQKVVALSSAEAELYAMVAASAENLAVAAYAKDLGETLGGEVFTDSSAALGITKRCGIGKVRHLRTQSLWVQETNLSGRLSYHKVPGEKNPADILTKYVPAELMNRHMETLNVELRGGRSEIAPELNYCVVEGVRWHVPKEERRVRFCDKVAVRGIPADNTGRPCKLGRKTPAARRTSTGSKVAGGAVESSRPRWADVEDRRRRQPLPHYQF